MADFTLDKLGPREFEHLTQSLAIASISPGVTPFGDGPDGAREATFRGRMNYDTGDGRWDGYLVIQSKFKARLGGRHLDGNWLLTQFRTEIKKFTDPARGLEPPEYYILATNVVLTAIYQQGSKDKLRSELDDYLDDLGVKGWDLWDYDKVCRLLDVHGEVRRAFAGLLTPGDVLEELHNRVKAQSQLALTNSFDRYRALAREAFRRGDEVSFYNLPSTVLSSPHLVPYMGEKVTEGSKREPLFHPDGESLLIWGEPGSGKTTQCLLVTEFLLEIESVYPFFVDLSRARENLTSEVLRQIGEAGSKLDLTWLEFYDFATQHNVVILLDGFDEMTWLAFEERSFTSAVDEIARFARICCVVVAVRSHLFQSERAALDLFGKRFRLASLPPLSPAGIDSLLEIRGNEKIRRALNDSASLRSVASRPLVLSMLLYASIDGLDASAPIAEAQVYHKFTEELIFRDRLRRRYLSAHQVASTLREIAFEMVRMETSDISYDKIIDLVLREELSKSSKDLILHDLVTSSLLTRSWREHHLRFAHKSFFDYFVAQSILTHIRAGDLPQPVTIMTSLYFMLQTLLFVRAGLRINDAPQLAQLIASAAPPARAVLLMVSRYLIEQDESLRDYVVSLLDSSELDFASAVEIIYAVYRFADTKEKERLASILQQREDDFLRAVRIQFRTDADFLEWARARIQQPHYREGREFLYIYPLAIAGDATDIARIRSIEDRADPLLVRQVLWSLERLASRLRDSSGVC